MSRFRWIGQAVVLLPVLFAQDPGRLNAQSTAAGFDKVRIEQEDRLAVPLEKGDEVWAYMLARFVNEQTFIRSIDSTFSARWNLEEFWDIYFDTPSLQLLQSKGGVRHRRRINHSDPESVKSGRELMQIKISDIAGNPLERGEIKYSIEHPLRFDEPDDGHPMIGIVRPSHRREFKERLAAMGLAPYSMRPILMVHDMRSRIYWTVNGNPFMSISFDRADSKLWWAKHEFIEVEPELNEIAFTDADSATRVRMEAVLQRVVADLRQQFPFLVRDLTPKYNRMFVALGEQIPGLPTLVRLNVHGTSGLVGLVTVVVLLLAAAAFGIVKLRSQRRDRQENRRLRAA